MIQDVNIFAILFLLCARAEDMALIVQDVENALLGPWNREQFCEGYQSGFGHIVHALVEMAKMFFGKFWCQHMTAQDYVVSEMETPWVQRGEPEMVVMVLYPYCLMSKVFDSF